MGLSRCSRVASLDVIDGCQDPFFNVRYAMGRKLICGGGEWRSVHANRKTDGHQDRIPNGGMFQTAVGMLRKP